MHTPALHCTVLLGVLFGLVRVASLSSLLFNVPLPLPFLCRERRRTSWSTRAGSAAAWRAIQGAVADDPASRRPGVLPSPVRVSDPVVYTFQLFRLKFSEIRTYDRTLQCSAHDDTRALVVRACVLLSPELCVVIVGSEHTATLNYQLTAAAHVHFSALS